MSQDPHDPAAGAEEAAARRAEQVVAAMMEKDAFSQWLGVEVLAVAPGRAVIRMTVRAEMCNGFGIGHGGIAYAFADSALAFASNGHGRMAVALDNSIHYPAAVHTGDVLTATATERSRSHRVAAYDVVVTRETATEPPTPAAFFQGTVYRTSKTHPDG